MASAKKVQTRNTYKYSEKDDSLLSSLGLGRQGRGSSSDGMNAVGRERLETIGKIVKASAKPVLFTDLDVKSNDKFRVADLENNRGVLMGKTDLRKWCEKWCVENAGFRCIPTDSGVIVTKK